MPARPPAATMPESESRRLSVKHKHEQSREEQLATEVLALVDRFHRPAEPAHRDHHRTRLAARMAVPAALEALALLSFAHQLRARHQRPETPAMRLRRGVRRAFVLRHL
jgi:hypothetical protein